MKDLTKIKDCKAVGPQLLPIVQKIDKYTLEQLKRELTRILTDPSTSISPEKSSRYMTTMGNIYNLKKMQYFLSDLYLASAGMGVTKKIRK